MDSGFKDPIAPKPMEKKKSPWNFDAPPYDQRSGCFVEAGDNHGIGHKQPIGHHGNPKDRVDTLPYGRLNTKKSDYVYKGKNSYQIDINNEIE